MSRTSRRISRPLIGVLAVVIVLGVVFTVHKVHKSHAQVAANQAPVVPANPATPVPGPTAAPAAPAPKASSQQPDALKTIATAAPKPAPPSPAPLVPTPAAPAAPAEPVALVTQTPTEKMPASNDASAAPKSEPGSVGSPETSADAPVAPVSAPTSVGPAGPGPATTPPPTQPALTDATATTASPASPASPAASVPDSATSANDAASLQEWAKGGSKTAAGGSVTASPSIAPGSHDLPAPSIADAKTKLDAGDLISARQILNDNLIASRGDADALKQQIEQINQTLIFSPKKFPDDPWGGSYQVAAGERLGSIANRNSVTWDLLARINNVTPKKLRQGQWIKIVKGPFFAVVTKHTFKMDLYLGAPGGPGSMFVRTFMVGLGKDNSTPTGLWMCKSGDKIRNPRYYPSRGGDIIAPNDPKNPLGGYWIAIEGLDGQAVGKESYGIHGTIEPDSIGKMSSQGCIRLRTEDISWVFDLLVDGKSKVLVKD